MSRTEPQHSVLVWEGVKEVPVHRCQRVGCTAPPFVQKARGRTRKYCSDACKQATHRSARAERSAERAVAPTAQSNPWPRAVRPRRGRRMPYRFLDYTETDAAFPDIRDVERVRPEAASTSGGSCPSGCLRRTGRRVWGRRGSAPRLPGARGRLALGAGRQQQDARVAGFAHSPSCTGSATDCAPRRFSVAGPCCARFAAQQEG